MIQIYTTLLALPIFSLYLTILTTSWAIEDGGERAAVIVLGIGSLAAYVMIFTFIIGF